MGNMLLGTPNWIKEVSTFPVFFGSGTWETTDPLTNLQGIFFFDKAISDGVALADTRLDVDLDIQRDIKMVVITNSNATKAAKIKIRAATKPAWSGVVVDGVNNLAATTLNITEGAETLAVGECFSITGDDNGVGGTETVYNITSVSAGSVDIANVIDGLGLLKATTGAEVMTSHSGDFVSGDSVVFDTGFVDYFGQVIPVGSKVWGQAGVWDGKISDEDIATLDFPNPFILIRDEFDFAQYFRIEFDDTTNPNSGIEIDGMYIASAYRPTNNLSFGTSIGLLSNTTSEESAGGVEIFNDEQSQRFLSGKLQNIAINEAWINIHDNQRRLDKSGDFFFVFDESATTLLNRQSFPARLTNLAPLEYNFFNIVDVPIAIKEKLA